MTLERTKTVAARRWAAGLGGLAFAVALVAGPVVGDAWAKESKDSQKPAATAGTQQPTSGEDFHWAWKLAAGKTIEIKGVNGDVRARRSTGSQVDVKAWKHAKRSDPEEVKIEFVEHAGGVTVCAVYPGPGNICAPGSGGSSHTHNNDVVVDFEVLVPAGVAFAGRTVNGAVEAEALQGPVEAHTVNGSVRVSTSKQATASTVNGSITARLGDATKEDLEFTTVNGGITLELPDALNADLTAATVNGSIQTDFPITVTGTFGRHHLNGTIGKGGSDLKVETVNGSIRLRRVST